MCAEHRNVEGAERDPRVSRATLYKQQWIVSKGRGERRWITEAALFVFQRSRLEAAKRGEKRWRKIKGRENRRRGNEETPWSAESPLLPVPFPTPMALHTVAAEFGMP